MKTRPSFLWIYSTDTYKPHLTFIYAQMLERERERESGRELWSTRLKQSISFIQKMMSLKVVFRLIIFSINFKFNPAINVVCLFIYVHVVCFFAYIIYFNAHLEIKYYKVNINQIVEDVFKCRLHINKTFNRVWIESSLNCCLFVYIHIVCLFVYISYINNQLVPKA